MYFTYILQSESSGRYYIGSTEDLDKRLLRHNRGYSKYTKNKGPFVVVFKQEFETRSEAVRREKYIKSLKSRKAIEKLVQAAVV